VPAVEGIHVHVGVVLQSRPTLQLLPSKILNWYVYGAVPPLARAVHLIGVPAATGAERSGVNAVAVSESGRPAVKGPNDL
jgi:hypothetical protein